MEDLEWRKRRWRNRWDVLLGGNRTIMEESFFLLFHHKMWLTHFSMEDLFAWLPLVWHEPLAWSFRSLVTYSSKVHGHKRTWVSFQTIFHRWTDIKPFGWNSQYDSQGGGDGSLGKKIQKHSRKQRPISCQWRRPYLYVLGRNISLALIATLVVLPCLFFKRLLGDYGITVE